VTVIEPIRGWCSLDLREIWVYRALLFVLTMRDIKIRYKQTVLGAAGAILQPFMTMVVFTVLFGRLRDGCLKLLSSGGNRATLFPMWCA
jgi:lipopolysaccharide transport system permease protein